MGGQKFATEQWRSPARWLEAAEADGAQSVQREIPKADQADELMMMGLRLSEGVDLERWHALSGRHLNEDSLAHLCDIGMLSREGSRLRATTEGRMVLNTLLAEILVD